MARMGGEHQQAQSSARITGYRRIPFVDLILCHSERSEEPVTELVITLMPAVTQTSSMTDSGAELKPPVLVRPNFLARDECSQDLQFGRENDKICVCAGLQSPLGLNANSIC